MEGFLPLAREIVLGAAASVLERPAAEVASRIADGPRRRFLAACLRLEARGSQEAATACRIYAKSDLADEIALPDAEAAGRVIRLLNGVDGPEAREAIGAVCDMLADPLAGPERP